MLCHLESLKSLRSDKTAVIDLLGKCKRNHASDDKLQKLQDFIDEIDHEEKIQ